MNTTFVLSTIVVFAAVFALGVSPIGSAFAGNGGGGEPANDCGGKPTIQGTSGDDTLYTGGSAEVYNMKDGNDMIDDYEYESYDDTYRMGDGNDTVYAMGGNDTLCLGDGNDMADTMDDMADYIKCGPGNDTVYVDFYDIAEDDCENVILGYYEN